MNLSFTNFEKFISLKKVPFIISIYLAIFPIQSQQEEICVTRNYQGGRQCEKIIEYFNPELQKQKIINQNILVIDKFFQNNPVCAGCGCPGYSVDVSFKVFKKDLYFLEKLGYKKIKCFWDNKYTQFDLDIFSPTLKWSDEIQGIYGRGDNYDYTTCYVFLDKFITDNSSGNGQEIKLYKNIISPSKQPCDLKNSKSVYTYSEKNIRSWMQFLGINKNYIAFLNRLQIENGAQKDKLIIRDIEKGFEIYSSSIKNFLVSSPKENLSFEKIIASYPAAINKTNPVDCKERIMANFTEIKNLYESQFEQIELEEIPDLVLKTCSYQWIGKIKYDLQKKKEILIENKFKVEFISPETN